ARQLHGFDKAAPKQLSRKFVETAGVVEVQAERVVVHFDKRCHNPILREAALDAAPLPLPWLGNKTLTLALPWRNSGRSRKLWGIFAPRKSAVNGLPQGCEITSCPKSCLRPNSHGHDNPAGGSGPVSRRRGTRLFRWRRPRWAGGRRHDLRR